MQNAFRGFLITLPSYFQKRSKYFFKKNLLRYNWHITLYWFQVYHVKLLYLWILWNVRHSKSSYHLSPHKVNFEDLLSRQLSSTLSTLIDPCRHAILYIPVIYLVCNWKLVPPEPLFMFYSSPTLLPPATTALEQVFWKLAIYQDWSGSGWKDRHIPSLRGATHRNTQCLGRSCKV